MIPSDYIYDIEKYELEKSHRQSRLQSLVGCVFRHSSAIVLYGLNESPTNYQPENGALGLITGLMLNVKDNDDVYKEDINLSLRVLIDGRLYKLNDCLQKFVDVYEIYKNGDKQMERVTCQIFDT